MSENYRFKIFKSPDEPLWAVQDSQGDTIIDLLESAEEARDWRDYLNRHRKEIAADFQSIEKIIEMEGRHW